MENYKRDSKYWVGFSLIPGIGPVRFNQLQSHFPNLAEAWAAGPKELKQAGLDSGTVKSIVTSRPGISLDVEMEKLDRTGVQAIISNSPDYPKRLKEIYDFPPVLYVKGTLSPRDDWTIAVVGTRRATNYGRQVTEEITSDLVKNNVTIASGLARGIDTIAHRSALEAGGRTLAVFACGLDIVYPSENAELARRITLQGALVSEYPPGTKPRPDYFPRRNRIMSGLSLGVLVVEAGETSGAMITARLALEQNREVFAVPGSILSPASIGTNKLIQEGAKLVRDYRDVLQELNLTVATHQMEMKDLVSGSETEAALLKQLGHEPIHIDEVCRSSGLPISSVSSTLAMMELKGLVKQVGAMNYALAREGREEYTAKVE
ncbi:MAG: DNA-processing protein DprA [Dehalococcoidales bacterium]|nr:DNA-processing protein DprA [Dehalococcoidales bacterium]